MTKSEIQRIRHTRVIRDPFPEHTFHETHDTTLGRITKFFGLRPRLKDPRCISIWDAHKIGYDKAYDEMLSAAKDD